MNAPWGRISGLMCSPLCPALRTISGSQQVVRLHPAGLQSLYLPNHKTKERAQSQWQRHQWFNGWGILHVWSKVLEWHPTACGRRWGHGCGLRYQGKREMTSYRRNWCQVGSWVARETSRGVHLTAPLINYHSGGSSDLKIRTITSWGWGQVHRHLLIRLYDLEGRLVRWVGCRWSRDWSSRGCTESKRTAILCGLLIHRC